MNYFWSIISGLGAILTIIIWAKDSLKEKPRRMVYPLVLVLLTVFSTYQFEQNRRLTTIKSEALSLVESWPGIDRLKYCSKGQRMGIILGGLGFLEKHKSDIPDTYTQAANIVKNRLRVLVPQRIGTRCTKNTIC